MPDESATETIDVQDFAERNLAFQVQNAYLTALAQRFDAGGRNLPGRPLS